MITDELNTVLDWSKLSMRDRAAFIRLAVANGYKDVDSIRNLYKEGGDKNSNLKKLFLTLLDSSLLDYNQYNTPLWRKFFTDLALLESSFKPNILNDIGAKGYFQLMPYNRSASWSSPTQLFHEMYKLVGTNEKTLMKKLTNSDIQKAYNMGIDWFGLLAGAHLGGVGNVIKALRGLGNAKDKNNASVLGYMKQFSQGVIPTRNDALYTIKPDATYTAPIYSTIDTTEHTPVNNITIDTNEDKPIENDNSYRGLIENVSPEVHTGFIPIQQEYMSYAAPMLVLPVLQQQPKVQYEPLDTSLLLKDLEYTILNGLYANDLEKENLKEDLRFLLNISANGGRLYPIGGNLVHNTNSLYVSPIEILPEEIEVSPNATLRRSHKVFSNYDEAKDNPLSSFTTTIRNAARWVKDNVIDIPSGVSNCTLSASLWIDPANPIKNASSIIANPEEYNYIPIEEKDARLGDVLITRNPNNDSYHTMVVSGYTPEAGTYNFDGTDFTYKANEPLLTYSRGGHDVSFIRRNIPLSVYMPNSDGKTEKYFYRYKRPNIILNALLKKLNGGNLFAPGGEIEDEEYKYATTYLPEVTVTAPRLYIERYDENGNPVYTTDSTKSMGYNAPVLQSHLNIQEALKEKPNTGKQWADLATQGIGLALAPITAAPVVEAGLPIMNTMARPLTPGSSFWMNPATKQILTGTAMSEGVNLANKAVSGYNTVGEGIGDLVQKATGWNPNNTWLGPLVTEAFNPGWYISLNGVMNTVGRIGNTVGRGKSLLSNEPLIARGTPEITAENATSITPVVNTYEIERYPGYQLKTLMAGNPLEKQLSKTGTISVNSIKALAAKSSNVDKEVIDKVLSSEQFANKKSIDYNAFRKAVLDELIGSYNRVPLTEWADYGVESLGYNLKTVGENELPGLPNLIILGLPVRYTPPGTKADPISLSTFTFESPYIPRGNDTHYNPSTLGHSRTFTTKENPDILHVMESQSDWGLQTKDLAPKFSFKRAENGNTNVAFDINGKFHFVKDGEGMPYKDFMNLDLPREQMPHIIAKNQFVSDYQIEQVKHLHDKYLQRQLQENLRYAAENGLTKMRYPTRETAAKIEGYTAVVRQGDEYNKLLKEYTNLDVKIANLNTSYRNKGIEPISQPDYRKLLNQRDDLKVLLELEKKNTKLGYRPEHETILKKYTDFPKQFKKLYKDADVRTVTDTKGNTWYEVDVPKDYLKQEWLFAKGGRIANNNKQ